MIGKVWNRCNGNGEFVREERNIREDSK